MSNDDCVYATFSASEKLAISDLLRAYIESLIRFGLTRYKVLMPGPFVAGPFISVQNSGEISGFC